MIEVTIRTADGDVTIYITAFSEIDRLREILPAGTLIFAKRVGKDWKNAAVYKAIETRQDLS